MTAYLPSTQTWTHEPLPTFRCCRDLRRSKKKLSPSIQQNLDKKEFYMRIQWISIESPYSLKYICTNKLIFTHLKNSWNWLITLMSKTVWQILNEMTGNGNNVNMINLDRNNSWMTSTQPIYWRVWASWDHCVHCRLRSANRQSLRKLCREVHVPTKACWAEQKRNCLGISRVMHWDYESERTEQFRALNL